ncbi:efflux RND transporter permease subunit [Desulfovibrio sp. OttesenSCG-928-C14]|nr:efflux RND transporter permease subunit [Desulfovibrio sp. OttesenSCG-928-C14]
MAKFFIDRPIFAWVIAILIMLAGTICLYRLPVAQYPSIAAPEVTISAMYPGASAKTVEDTVTQVIEQQMKGLDNLMYMYADSNSFGQATISFAFEAGTDIDIAQVQVQNKLQLATPLLPEEVQRQGVSVTKSVRNFLMVVAFASADGSMEGVDIGDYITTYVQDPISRLPGVGETSIYGAQYAMRIWCDPERMEQYKLNPSDIIAAIRDQNAQVAGGQIGAGPARPGQQINVTINASSRLTSVEQFENILLRTDEDGSVLYLKDVARAELNSEQFIASAGYNGMNSAGLAIKLASGANALETARAIKAELKSLSEFFPHGLEYHYAYDTAPIVEQSVQSVFKTLLEAIALVFLIMFLFLQNFRATLIPTIAIPVVLLGTFGVLAAFGYSINTLTMFGMVLAIGLLVDDAIVVVENVERLMHEERLSPREAARKSMDQITGALVGVALVICAVFVPMAFMGGSTGVIYRQFSITIVTAMVLSVVVAIVLTPALCATMLKNKPLSSGTGLFGHFNRWFERVTDRYQGLVGRMIRGSRRYVAAFAAGLALIAVMFVNLPSAFLPEEDQGLFITVAQLPAGATFERTQEVLEQVEDYYTKHESGVQSVMAIHGVSLMGTGQNTGMAMLKLKDWSERGKGEDVFSILRRANAHFANIPEASVFAFAPPAILELGNASGFDFELIDRAGQGHDALMQARNLLLQKANAHPAIANARPNGLDDVEQVELDIDLAKAGAQSLSKGEINTAVAAYWGSVYVNDFMDKGRTKKVYLQADSDFRMQASDFDRYHVRNSKGEMVPFSSFLSMHSVQGSPRLERYGGLPAIQIQGEAAPGYSSGQAMAAMEELVKELPGGFGYAWTGLSYQEVMSGNQAPLLYALSLIVVFLCLAALYESWSIPISVLLAVPTGVLGALLGVYLRGMNNDIYFQIGLLTIIGLSAKNSILIVEFAKSLWEEGLDLLEATTQAVRMRLRPIIMTSLCFILGVVPLAISSGAGSGGQNALGTTVAFGMLTATGLGIFFTPIFFVLVSRLFGKKKAAAPEAAPAAAPKAEAALEAGR